MRTERVINDIKVMRRCADREEQRVILAVSDAPAKLYIIHLRRALTYQTGNGEVHRLTPSLTHLLTYMVIY